MDGTILLPVDPDTDSTAATDCAIASARQTDATIRVLSVLEFHDLESLPAAETASLRAAATRRARAAVDAAAERIENAGIPVVRDRCEGVPYQEIVSLAAQTDPGLIVMGTRGSTTADEPDPRVGSTTQRVLALSAVPVLAVPLDRQPWPDTASAGCSRVVIATDGSDAAERAADSALELVAAARGVVDVISVIDETAPILEDAPASVLELRREGGHDAIEPIAVTARSRDLEVRTDVLRGVPHDELVSYASAVDADLLAMGARGLAVGGDPVLGGTTARVLERADRPVLAVR
ncbi:universal stress protein [Natronorubrum sulfidifaciens]|uniref:UspA domain-containing protein n=1 Tax=Natronorubrum sulfidifaciens JCM 14089 TaxID=1230460 RepID=L9W561_9EURY|nr:universal stress protein [Natronorubrum sulfidifaciens]ELY44585.1 UspA domain-containing protein [Natronorubrum sulfidifaciens JCM 14089]